jgi:hypothetical protein
VALRGRCGPNGSALRADEDRLVGGALALVLSDGVVRLSLATTRPRELQPNKSRGTGYEAIAPIARQVLFRLVISPALDQV